MIFILNTLAVPVDFSMYPSVFVRFTKISVDQAKDIISKNQFVSAVGHEATAKLLSNLLGVEVPVSRREVFMEPGDKAIHFRLKARLPEGAVLGVEQLEKIGFELVLSEVIHP